MEGFLETVVSCYSKIDIAAFLPSIASPDPSSFFIIPKKANSHSSWVLVKAGIEELLKRRIAMKVRSSRRNCYLGEYK
jgi:hypothetical protein